MSNIAGATDENRRGVYGLSRPPLYCLRKPLPDCRTELVLTPVELLAYLAALISPPLLYKHRT